RSYSCRSKTNACSPASSPLPWRGARGSPPLRSPPALQPPPLCRADPLPARLTSMRRFLPVLLLAGLLPGFLPPALGQAALDTVRTVAGITECRPENGLRVLMLPGPGADTITVHVTYRVGSRHEGYGEKGMAHL